MSDLVGNPEDRFSRVAAHMLFPYSYVTIKRYEITMLKQPIFRCALKKAVDLN